MKENLEELENELSGITIDHDPTLTAKDIDNNSKTYNNVERPEYPLVRLKELGTYSFFLCPPFEKHSSETPWGGRPALVYRKHWGLPTQDGRQFSMIDYENSFPWLNWNNPINRVIEKWTDQGMEQEVADYVSNAGFLANIILLESPDSNHKEYINEVKDGKLVGEPIVCVLDTSISTLKFIQEQLDSKYAKYPIFDPVRGSIVQITKSQRTIKGGKKRTEYKRNVVPNSPRWYQDLPIEEATTVIKDVLQNRLHNLYDILKPDGWADKNAKEYAERIDFIIKNKFDAISNSASLSENKEKKSYQQPHNTLEDDFVNRAKDVDTKSEQKPFNTEDQSSKGSDKKEEEEPKKESKSNSMDFDLPPLPSSMQ